MGILVSPGVLVTVTDESQYASAGFGTIPLIVIATASNKFVPGSTSTYATGTLKIDTENLYLITGQRDLLQTFGSPIFYTSGGSPEYDNQLNELGLFSAYQYLGIANTAYILRANVNTAEMIPTTVEPSGEADTGQYWLDTDRSTWGIFQSNGNVNSALAWSTKTPTVLTDATYLELIAQGEYCTDDGNNPIITNTDNLVINGTAVPLTTGMSIADVASAINNSTALHDAGITATIYTRYGKPDVTVSAVSDMFYLRLVNSEIDSEIELAGSDPTILINLGFIDGALTPDPTPPNYVVPKGDYLTEGDYVIDAYSTYNGYVENSVWQKLTLETSTETTNWWFRVGSTDNSFPGWGWREAQPRQVTGSKANPILTIGEQCYIGIGTASPVLVTISGTTLTSFIDDVNAVLSANSFNAYASKITSGSSNYFSITNFDGTDIFFNDVSTQAGTQTPWEDVGIQPTQTYYGSITGTVANPSFVAATRYVASGSVVAAGAGYVVGDTLNVVGGTHSVTGVLQVSAIQVVSASISAAGTGYAVNDTLTFNGPNYTSPVVVKVTTIGGAGSITGLQVISNGQYTASTPTNPVTPTSTSGSGINATVTLGWGVATVTVNTPGNYTVDPTNPVSTTGGSGAGATFNVTMAYLTSNTFTIDPGTDGSGTQTINVPAYPNNTVSGVVAAINAAFPSGPIVASVATGGYLKITNTNGTQFILKDVSGTPLNSAGIKVGYVFGRQLTYYGYYPSLTVPSTLAQLAVENVWINTTQQNYGANLVVKRYNGSIWVTQNRSPNSGTVPMYSNDSVANAAFGGSKAIGTCYWRYNATGTTPAQATQVLYRWDGTAWVRPDYTASDTAPAGPPADGTLWYSTDLRVDIMVGDGQVWLGYRNYYPATDPNGVIISGSEPSTQSDGSPLVDNDIWLDSASSPYPVLYRWDTVLGEWVLIDNTDHSSPGGIIFKDARWNDDGQVNGSQLQSAMVLSDYVDSDAPNAELYPAGMLLFNTRYTTYNVKEYKVDYFPTLDAPFMTSTWVTKSGNRPDGTPYMGPLAQRAVIVTAMQSALVSNTEIRAEAVNYNLIATPGYIECLDEMITLNTDKKEVAFIIADTPGTLPADGTSLQRWATNANNAAENSAEGLISSTPYAAVYYPWGLSTNLDGKTIFVPPSEMALRTYAYNDQVAYPWFAPAGFNRGLVTGVTSVGYLKSDGTYQPVTLNQGQRDILYLNRINPIAFIPGRGLVIYGQKTLNAYASALDRVNVARLINYLKYQLDNLAKPFLFEPNDKQTRQSVTNTFNSFMGNLIGLRALYDYAVICDETNNTPARIDANELWIDIAIKPTKAIEFIYIPIRILNTGDPLPNGAQNPTNV